MTKGAMDVLSKPDSRNGMTLSLDFRSEFLLKLSNIVAGPGTARPPAARSSISISSPAGPVDLRAARRRDAALSADRRLDRRPARRLQGAGRHRRRACTI